MGAARLAGGNLRRKGSARLPSHIANCSARDDLPRRGVNMTTTVDGATAAVEVVARRIDWAPHFTGEFGPDLQLVGELLKAERDVLGELPPPAARNPGVKTAANALKATGL